jgi:hypothetical protein
VDFPLILDPENVWLVGLSGDKIEPELIASVGLRAVSPPYCFGKIIVESDYVVKFQRLIAGTCLHLSYKHGEKIRIEYPKGRNVPGLEDKILGHFYSIGKKTGTFTYTIVDPPS